ncbi:ABC transporter permease [Thalassospira tepidiphila]|uniref:Sugar ABC transporter permease n=2 Tax=Thalassospira tepidiphila TaxID=393657 RepID=A0A853L0H8_9PROT|nr:ABC transporter permease [Thalassospira tepidiphila]NJB76392.1 simple sugar transport system permease protein [Thalassospira tepidiphila]OAZ09731.1 sugar ABC transporter permease [Thalassospira tepidiphila MCCC 1A03514]
MSSAGTSNKPAPGHVSASGQLQQRRGLGDLIAKKPEMVTLGLLIAICIAVAIANPAFLQPSTLIDIGRASVVTGLFALGVFVILAAGGIDVSFTAIAALTMYSITLLAINHAPNMPIYVVFLIAVAGGIALGVLNGFLVYTLRVPSLIVTIGTQYLFRGGLLAFVGTTWIMELPGQMGTFGRISLLEFETANGATVSLPVYFLILPAAAILTWWIMRRTLMGRAIFSLGGSPDVTARLGYNVKIVHLFVFGYAGALAGLAGIVHVTANRLANPFDLVGTEIAVIAAVVLGGARITGGTGSVIGTMLGVLLVVVVDNVLVMVGIPSTWQRVFVGAFILLAAAFFVTRQRKFKPAK